jgi:hypothetical protein
MKLSKDTKLALRTTLFLFIINIVLLIILNGYGVNTAKYIDYNQWDGNPILVSDIGWVDTICHIVPFSVAICLLIWAFGLYLLAYDIKEWVNE